jgi:hypothetical protein
MKIQWLLVAACSAALCIFAGSGAQAQDRNDQDRDQAAHFTPRDRDVLSRWYRDHADWIDQYRNEGWHDQDLDRRLEVGAVIGPDMRRWSHPLPEDLVSQMDPLPRYWRVVVVGDHAVLVDADWNVRDVFHFENFDDHDRQVIRDWNRDHPDFVRGLLGSFGVRIDEADLDRRLQVGQVVDPELRDHAHPVPDELAARLTPAPRDWRYMVIGDRLCLVDRDWRIRESFRFER